MTPTTERNKIRAARIAFVRACRTAEPQTPHTQAEANPTVISTDLARRDLSYRHALCAHRLAYYGHKYYLGFSTSKDGKVAYTPEGKDHYQTKDRRVTTLARFCRRMAHIGDWVPDSTLATWCQNITAGNTEAEIEIIAGDGIYTVYEKGIGFHSCMCGDKNHLVELYAINPDRVSCVVASQNGRSARALLWHTDNGQTVIDRIYPDDQSVIQGKLRDWAQDKGYPWVFKHHCDYETAKTALVVSGLHRPKYFPYFDTFYHAALTDDQTVKLSTAYFPGAYFCDSTQGHGPMSIIDPLCHSCGREMNDDAKQDPNGHWLCEECYDELWTQCTACESRISRESASYTTDSEEPYCRCCRNDYLFTCQHCHGLFRNRTHTATDDLLCNPCYHELKNQRELDLEPMLEADE